MHVPCVAPFPQSFLFVSFALAMPRMQCIIPLCKSGTLARASRPVSAAQRGMFYELANWVGTTVFLGCSLAHCTRSIDPPLVRNLLVLFLRCAIIIMSSLP